MVSAFYMERREVSKRLWDSVFTWATSNGYAFFSSASGDGDHPANETIWSDYVKWCNARSEKEGFTPCYYTTAERTSVYRTAVLDLSESCVDWSANGYRLPTEAEWEKAARGGLQGHRFPWGDVETISHSRANYYSSQLYDYDVSPTPGWHPIYHGLSPVGSFAPNEYGLYDMAGNIWEWCWDWHDSAWYSNPDATQDDTHDPPSSPNGIRIVRGGYCGDDAFNARSSFRNKYWNPHSRSLTLGFRCCRGL